MRFAFRRGSQAPFLLATVVVFLASLVAKALRPEIDPNQLGAGVIIGGLFALMRSDGGAAVAPGAPAPIDEPGGQAPAPGGTPAQRQAAAGGLNNG